jgi:predicted exporter
MPNRVPLLLVWLALLLLIGGGLITTLKPKSDLSLFLPQGRTEVQQLLLNELHQGRATRLLMIAIAGGDAEGRADVSQGLVAALRRSERFEQVENGAPGNFAFDTQLMRYRYLLTGPQRLQDSLSVDGLRTALEARLTELQSPLPNPFKSLIARDPTSAYASLLKAWQADNRIQRNAGVWSSQEGDMALLLATGRDSGLALEQQSEAVTEIQGAFDRLNPEGSYRLLLSGPGAFAVLSKRLIETESRQLSLLASGVILLLLLLAYRRLPYLLYAALPLLSALLVAILLTRGLFDSLHGITLAFGITLLGVTLDYPLHLFSHLTENEPAGRTMQRIWPTLRLGVITTCLGYLVLVTTDFTGLRQLGVFTLAGLVTAALVSRYLLPRLLADTAPPAPRNGPWLRFFNRPLWLPALVLAGLTLLAGVILGTHSHLWNDDVGVLSPLPTPLLEQDRFLRRQLMADESNQMLLLRGRDMEQLLARCEALRLPLQHAVDDRLLAGASLPCDTLPSRARQMQSRARIPQRAEMARRLNLALEGLPFRARAFEGFLDDLELSRTLAPLDYDALQPGLARERLEALVRSAADGWLALAPLRLVTSGDALSQRLEGAPDGVSYVNLREETSRLIGGFRQEILGQVALGILVMLVVLWLGLRSLRHAVGVLLPIAAAILTTLALPPLMGGTMNLFHLISLMLVLGIGIDFSLFFSRQGNHEHEREETLHALTLCALSTVSVFAILGTSSIPVLQAIGTTVASGVALSYFATYAFWHLPRNPLRGPEG